MAKVKLSRGTQSNYDNLQNKDPDTVYIRTDTGNMYLGHKLLSQRIPLGGESGYVLSKASDDDLDLEWVAQNKGYNFAFEIVNGNLILQYNGQLTQDFSIQDKNLIVTI